MSNPEVARIIGRADDKSAQNEDAAVARMHAALDAAYRDLERELLLTYPKYENNTGILGTQRALLLAEELQVQLHLIDPDSQRARALERDYEQLLLTQAADGSTLSEQLIKALSQEDLVALSTIDVGAVAYQSSQGMADLQKHTRSFAQSVTAILNQGLIQGFGVKKILPDIRNRLGTTKFEAERIARTQMIQALDASGRANMTAHNIIYVQRIATQDTLVCGLCAVRAGNIYRLDEAPAVIHPFDRCFNVPARPEWVDSGIIDPQWSQNHQQEVRAKTEQTLNYGTSYFEGQAGQSEPPKAVWTPNDGWKQTPVRTQPSPASPIDQALGPKTLPEPPKPIPTPDRKPRKTNAFARNWEEASFDEFTPPELRSAINRFDQPTKDKLNEGGAYYVRGDRSLSMGDYLQDDLEGQIVWRHEYGHFLDHHLSEQKFESLMRQAGIDPAELTDAKRIKELRNQGRLNTELWQQQAGRGKFRQTYISSSDAGQAALKTDAESIIRRHRAAIQAMDADLDQWEERLGDRAIAVFTGNRNVDVVTMVRDELGTITEEILESTEAYFSSRFDSIAARFWHASTPEQKTHMTNIEKASLVTIDRYDSPDLIASYLDLFLDGHGNALDMIGATTREEIGGGHGIEYYDARPDGQGAEAFANMISFYGLGEDSVQAEFAQNLNPRLYEFVKTTLKESENDFLP